MIGGCGGASKDLRRSSEDIGLTGVSMPTQAQRPDAGFRRPATSNMQMTWLDWHIRSRADVVRMEFHRRGWSVPHNPDGSENIVGPGGLTEFAILGFSAVWVVCRIRCGAWERPTTRKAALPVIRTSWRRGREFVGGGGSARRITGPLEAIDLMA